MTIDLTGSLSESSELVLAQRPAIPETRDAVNVWIEAADGAFGMRIGIEAVAEEWDAHDIWLDIAFADGRVISFRESDTPHLAIDEDGRPTIRGAGPLRFQCINPFQQWSVSFGGMAPQTTASDLIKQMWPESPPLVEVEFAIEMTMAVPPWVPGSLLAEARQVLTGEQGQFVSPRYEQLFRASGSLRVGNEYRDFSGCGLRIRRQGVRKFAGFQGHCWQSALFPGGKAFGYNTFPPRPDGKPSYNEGYIFDGDGVLKPARVVEVPWLTKLQAGGDDVSFVLETDEGRVAIKGTTFVNTRSRGHVILPPEFPIVQQAHARYHWNGEESCGMVERSSLKEKIIW